LPSARETGQINQKISTSSPGWNLRLNQVSKSWSLGPFLLASQQLRLYNRRYIAWATFSPRGYCEEVRIGLQGWANAMIGFPNPWYPKGLFDCIARQHTHGSTHYPLPNA
jgi:hypothetical protein